MIRPDFIFSNWIFLWYILYILNIIPYSPKLIFILGIIEVALSILILLWYGMRIKYIFLFSLINIALKVIPLYTIWTNKIVYLQDIMIICIILLVYSGWLYLHGENMISIYSSIFDSLLHHKNTTPLMYVLSKLHLN